MCPYPSSGQQIASLLLFIEAAWNRNPWGCSGGGENGTEKALGGLFHLGGCPGGPVIWVRDCWDGDSPVK